MDMRHSRSDARKMFATATPACHVALRHDGIRGTANFFLEIRRQLDCEALIVDIAKP